MDKPTLYLECNNCGMKFESVEQHNIHQSKFCAGSDYANYAKLQRILNHTTKEKQEMPLNLTKSINATEKFLASASKNQENASLNLNKLSQDISLKQQEFIQAAKKISNREDMLRDELEKISKAKNTDESELLQIMNDLEEKKIQEVRSLKEKEIVTRALKDLDRRNLNALEYQKKVQMKGLSGDRDNLKRKEDELFQEIERMKARLQDDEKNIKAEKDKINMNIVTIKDVNHELAEKRLEELSNIRGKEISNIKETKELLELEKEKIDSELKNIKKGDLSRKNNSGIMAGSAIMGPIVPLNLDDRRNLPDEVLRQNQKWKDDYERLNLLKKNHEEYVKNEPGYDVKPGPIDAKQNFTEEMKNMLGFYDGNLKPNQKARVLEYIKEDLDKNDPANPKSEKNQQNSRPGSNNNIPPKNNPLTYNTAKYKLSTEPYIGYNQSKNMNNEVDLYSPQAFSKYKQEEKNKYISDPNLLSNNKPQNYENFQQSRNYKQNDDVFNNNERTSNRRFTPDIKPKQNPVPQYTMSPGYGPNPYNPYGSFDPYNPYNPYQPYPPYPPYNPYNPDPSLQNTNQGPNPETLKLKTELEKLKKMLKDKSNETYDPRALENALNLQFEEIDHENALPEERVIDGLLQQERDELKLLSIIPRDSELYQAKVDHFKEMSQIRTRMEASLQELALQRMKRNMIRDDAIQEKKLAEEMWKEEQRRLAILNRMEPKQEANLEYSPIKGLYIAWDMMVGIPQKYRKSQIAYGIYERGESRMDPRLVLPSPTEDDPNNSLANRCFFKDVQDLKRLPAMKEIIAIIQVQGIDPYGKENAIGWTVLELFTTDKKVQEGHWKLPIYRNPQIINIYIPDLQMQVFLPNSFLYLRIFAADNAKLFPPAKDYFIYKIPIIHARENLIEPRSRQADQSRIATLNSRAPSNTGSNRMLTGLWIRLEALNEFQSRSLLKFKVSLIKGKDLIIDDRGGFCS